MRSAAITRIYSSFWAWLELRLRLRITPLSILAVFSWTESSVYRLNKIYGLSVQFQTLIGEAFWISNSISSIFVYTNKYFCAELFPQNLCDVKRLDVVKGRRRDITWLYMAWWRLWSGRRTSIWSESAQMASKRMWAHKYQAACILPRSSSSCHDSPSPFILLCLPRANTN